MTKYLLFALFLGIGIFIGYSLSYLNGLTGAVDYPPSLRQSNFVLACSSLNGQELTAENLSKLGGECWQSDTCNQTHIDQLNDGVPFFNATMQSWLFDNQWICQISKGEDNTIKARASYLFE